MTAGVARHGYAIISNGAPVMTIPVLSGCKEVMLTVTVNGSWASNTTDVVITMGGAGVGRMYVAPGAMYQMRIAYPATNITLTTPSGDIAVSWCADYGGWSL